MRTRHNLLLFLLISILSFTNSFGQETSKTKIPFINELYTIDLKLDRKLDYFSQRYEGFRKAELFKLSEDNYVLEIEQETNGERKVLSKSLNASQVESMQSMISDRVKTKNLTDNEDNSGRFLKVQSLALQGGIIGLTASNIFSNNTNSFALATASPLLGFGGGLMSGIFSTANRNTPLAPAMGYASGAFTGGLHGLFVGSLFIDDFEDAPTSIFLGASLFSIGESILLQHIIRKKELSAKRASAIRLGNLSGSLTGIGMGLMLGGEDFNRYMVTGMTLAGSVGGMLLYDRYFKDKDIDVGNLQAIRLMNPVFTIGTTVILSDILDDFSSAAVSGAIGIASSVGGVFLGEAIFGKGNVTYNESLWYGLGLYGGYLIGAGISVIALENSSLDSTPSIYAGTTTFCMLGGLYAVHSIVANNEEEVNTFGFLERNNIFIDANPAAIYVNKFIENPMFQQNALSIHWNF